MGLGLKSRVFGALSKSTFFIFLFFFSILYYIITEDMNSQARKPRALVPALTSIIFLGCSLFPCKRKSRMLHRCAYITGPMPYRMLCLHYQSLGLHWPKPGLQLQFQLWLRFRSPKMPHEGSRVRAWDPHLEDRMDVTPSCCLWGWCSPMLLVHMMLGGNEVLPGLRFRACRLEPPLRKP